MTNEILTTISGYPLQAESINPQPTDPPTTGGGGGLAGDPELSDYVEPPEPDPPQNQGEGVS